MDKRLAERRAGRTAERGRACPIFRHRHYEKDIGLHAPTRGISIRSCSRFKCDEKHDEVTRQDERADPAGQISHKYVG